MRFLSAKPQNCKINTKKSNSDHVPAVIDTLVETKHTNQDQNFVENSSNYLHKTVKERTKSNSTHHINY
jgi:hypothetical protein